MGWTNLLVSLFLAVGLAIARVAASLVRLALVGAVRALSALLRLASRPALRLVAGREGAGADEGVP